MGIIDDEATCDRTDRAELVEGELSAKIEREDRALSVKLHDDLAGKLDDGLIKETGSVQDNPSRDLDEEGLGFREDLDCRGARLAKVARGVGPCAFDELNLHDAGIKLTLIEVTEGVVAKIVDIDKDEVLRLCT